MTAIARAGVSGRERIDAVFPAADSVVDPWLSSYTRDFGMVRHFILALSTFLVLGCSLGGGGGIPAKRDLEQKVLLRWFDTDNVDSAGKTRGASDMSLFG